MAEKNQLCDKLTTDRIRALPIAQRSWPIPKLRRLCTDTFRLQLSFAWTPAEDFEFRRTAKGNTKLFAGTAYGGIPYAIGGLGNLYRWMEIYDEETGVMTIPENLPREFYKLFCNQCSFGAFWAWSRVSNSLKYRLTNDMMDRNGCIPIGEYDYDREAITDFEAYPTTRICEENGRQVMFRSYAVLQEADGIVNFTTGGHVRMISTVPVVVLNEDGTINGEESYTTFLDQAAKYHTMQQSDGSDYQVQGGVDTKITFEKLFTAGYLPFTIPEFAQIKGRKRKRVDVASAKLAGLDEEDIHLSACTVSSNYPISHLIFTAYNADGVKADRFVWYPLRGEKAFARYEQSLSFLTEEERFLAFAAKYKRITLSLIVGTGQELTVYKGEPLI